MTWPRTLGSIRPRPQAEAKCTGYIITWLVIGKDALPVCASVYQSASAFLISTFPIDGIELGGHLVPVVLIIVHHNTRLVTALSPARNLVQKEPLIGTCFNQGTCTLQRLFYTTLF